MGTIGSYFEILVFVTIGVALLWFGYSLFFGSLGPLRLTGLRGLRRRRRKKGGKPGDPQVCPVCSAILRKGELVSSHAYPSLSGGRDRLMHIQGCYFCLTLDRTRRCPVCGTNLRDKDYLISRMFERPRRRKHVQVLGCSICKRG